MTSENGAHHEETSIVARFHARAGQQNAVIAVLRDEVRSSRADPGCLAHEAYRSARDPRSFFILSRWVDEAAFENHASLPHTVSFVKAVRSLIDHELEPVRLRPI